MNWGIEDFAAAGAILLATAIGLAIVSKKIPKAAGAHYRFCRRLPGRLGDMGSPRGGHLVLEKPAGHC